MVTQARHQRHLENCLAYLAQARELLVPEAEAPAWELVALELKEAIREVGEITGQEVGDAGLRDVRQNRQRGARRQHVVDHHHPGPAQRPGRHERPRDVAPSRRGRERRLRPRLPRTGERIRLHPHSQPHPQRRGEDRCLIVASLAEAPRAQGHGDEKVGLADPRTVPAVRNRYKILKKQLNLKTSVQACF